MNALKWYIHLIKESQNYVDRILYTAGLSLATPPSVNTDSSYVPSETCPPQSLPTDEIGAASTSNIASGLFDAPDTQDLTVTRQLPDQPDHVNHHASEYLRQRCPLCFGGILKGENSSR